MWMDCVKDDIMWKDKWKDDILHRPHIIEKKLENECHLQCIALGRYIATSIKVPRAINDNRYSYR